MRENRDLRETNEILKAGASFLSSGSSTLASVSSRFHSPDVDERPWSRADVWRLARAGRRRHFTVISCVEAGLCRRTNPKLRGFRRPAQGVQRARCPGPLAA